MPFLIYIADVLLFYQIFKITFYLFQFGHRDCIHDTVCGSQKLVCVVSLFLKFGHKRISFSLSDLTASSYTYCLQI